MNFWKNNWSHLENFIRFFAERFLCILATLLFIALITFCFFKIAVIQNPEVVDSQEIYIYGISLDNLSTWFTFLGLIIAAFWSMHQYNKNKAIKQQERASEIAQDFADNIIEKLGLISDTLMPNLEIQKIVAQIVKSKQLKQFTTWEIASILGDEKCFEKYQQIIRSEDTQKRYTELLNKHYSRSEREKFNSCFPLLLENTLNHLEASCINISSKAAGSQFIYDSLHQSFLNTVEILAVVISTNNHNNIDKYFINIIEVYNMWNTQKEKDIIKFNKTQKKINDLNNKAKKEVFKLLNKKSKTV